MLTPGPRLLYLAGSYWLAPGGAPCGRLFPTLSGIAFIALLVFASVPAGTSPGVDDLAQARWFLEDPQFAMLLVEVTEARVSQGRNAAPPEGRLRVERVLRGELAPGSYRYRVSAPEGLDDRDARGEPTREWRERPLAGPETGDRVVAFSYLGDAPPQPGGWILLQGPRVRYTPESLSSIESEIVRDSPFLGPLFATALFLPVAGVVCLLLSLWRAVAETTRRRLERASVALPLVALAAYLVYDGLLSPAYDIRIDLLLLYPLLALGLAASVAGALRLARRRGAPPG